MLTVVLRVCPKALVQEVHALGDDVVGKLAADVAQMREKEVRVLVVVGGAKRIARQIKAFAESFRVVETRTPRLAEYRTRLRDQICASIGQPDLMGRLQQGFSNYGLRLAQILVTRRDLTDQGRYETLRDVFGNLLDLGVVPVVNTNEVFAQDNSDSEDSDQLACIISAAIQADWFVLVTGPDELTDQSQNGLRYDELGSIEDVNNLPPTPEKGIDARLDAIRMVAGLGIPSILCANYRDSLLRRVLFDADRSLTRVSAHGKRLKQLKSWVALAASSKGEVVVSTFLADNLRAKRAVSILVIGVEEVIGNFSQGDVITVKDVNGHLLGRGQTRLDSDTLRAIVRSLHKASPESSRSSDIVVHCDYFAVAPS